LKNLFQHEIFLKIAGHLNTSIFINMILFINDKFIGFQQDHQQI